MVAVAIRKLRPAYLSKGSWLSTVLVSIGSQSFVLVRGILLRQQNNGPGRLPQQDNMAAKQRLGIDIVGPLYYYFDSFPKLVRLG